MEEKGEKDKQKDLSPEDLHFENLKIQLSKFRRNKVILHESDSYELAAREGMNRIHRTGDCMNDIRSGEVPQDVKLNFTDHKYIASVQYKEDGSVCGLSVASDCHTEHSRCRGFVNLNTLVNNSEIEILDDHIRINSLNQVFRKIRCFNASLGPVENAEMKTSVVPQEKATKEDSVSHQSTRTLFRRYNEYFDVIWDSGMADTGYHGSLHLSNPMSMNDQCFALSNASRKITFTENVFPQWEQCATILVKLPYREIFDGVDKDSSVDDSDNEGEEEASEEQAEEVVRRVES